MARTSDDCRHERVSVIDPGPAAVADAWCEECGKTMPQPPPQPTREQLRGQIAQLREALELLLAEVGKSGNADARDFGWPVAVAKARAALRDTEDGR